MNRHPEEGHLPERNNFDLLRFIFASMVVLVHGQQLQVNDSLPFDHYLSSALAVQGFFVISGLLIYQSFERSRSLSIYAGKRLRRIYPAYVLVVLGCAVLGVLITTVPVQAYFGTAWLRYLVANLFFLNFLAPSLPGVFIDNPLVPAVNGALWTLKVEVAFYAAVPLLAWAMRRWDWRWVLGGLFALSVIYLEGVNALAAATNRRGLSELGNQLPGQMTYFCVGMAAFRLGRVRRLPLSMIAVVAIVAGFLSGFGMASLFRPIAVGGLVLVLGYGRFLGNFAKYGDFSYGIYILHFPILQTLIHFRALDGHPLALMLVGYALALGGAILLWHGVEKHFLARAGHYRKASNEPPVADAPIAATTGTTVR